jgi:TPR repeat protein
MRKPIIMVSREGKPIGEYYLDELEKVLRDKTILASDYYWQPGMTAWNPVGLLIKTLDSSSAAPQDTRIPLPGLFARSCLRMGLRTQQGVLVIVAWLAATGGIIFFLTQKSSDHRQDYSIQEGDLDPTRLLQRGEALYQKGLSLDGRREVSAESLPLFEQAGRIGHAKSQVKVGIYYEFYAPNRGRYESNLAINWLSRAAAQKESSAYFWLGQFYLQNKYLKDNAEACKWHYIGTKSGNPDTAAACDRMLKMYRSHPEDWGFVTEEQRLEGLRRALVYLELKDGR